MGLKLLKQSTAVTEKIGPFLDATDGVTEETGLATGGTEISKNGGAFATGPTLGTHDAEGYYPISLTTSHTDTLGRLRVKSHDSTTHLPVWEDYMVVPANVYDALVGGSDYLDVSLVQWLGTAPLALSSQRVQTYVGAMASGVIAAATFASGALDAVWSTTTRSLTTFGTLVADVWSYATRLLTGGTNIVLAKGVGVTGFNDLDAAGVRSAIGMSAANLDTQIATLATATALATVDAVVDSIKVDTGTSIPATLATIAGYIDTEIAAIMAKTDNLPADPATETTLAALSALSTAIKAKTDQMTFSYTSQLDANIKGINDTPVLGDGAATPWGP